MARVSTWSHRHLVVCLISTAMLGGGLSACGDDGISCAAVIKVAEPVLQLTVNNQQTGMPVSQVVLSNITINGAAASVSALVDGVPGANATVVGNTLTCTGSCKFGSTAGTYVFTVTSGGLPSVQLSVDAKYATRTKQGCEDIQRDGTALTVGL